MYVPSTPNARPSTLSVTVPNTGVTLNLTQNEAYAMLTQLSRRLVYDFDNMNYLLNADNVIAFVSSAYKDENNRYYLYFYEDEEDVISDFLSLDKNTQRDMASDALSNTITTYEVCDIEAPLDEVLEDIILHAALDLIESYRNL